MRRIIATILSISLVIALCSCNAKQTKKIKIGIIDSSISEVMQEKLGITNMHDIVGVKTENNITHGSMIASIILQDAPNSELFYCSIYDEICIGKVEYVVTALNWCIENNVDIITMSFATINDNQDIKECIERAIANNIIIIASCINLSDRECYPAMYNGVISVSEGFNSKATVILRGKQISFKIDDTAMKKREVSFLTAFVCGKIANQLSMGTPKEEVLNALDFN